MTPRMAEQPLSLENVSISYGKTTVIEGVTYHIRKGETFGLMGLNGAGKTTLIKAILGLRELDAGDISIFGRDRGHPLSKKETAYLPERFEPPWFLTGVEFLRFSLELYKRRVPDEELENAARQLALEPTVLKQSVQTYSKGMRQKLGLLATLLTGCDLLILDEPMSGLDPQARAYVKDALRKARDEKKTIFLSSHILADMDEICDRVAILDKGSLVFTGTPKELHKLTGIDNMERSFLQVIEKGVPEKSQEDNKQKYV